MDGIIPAHAGFTLGQFLPDLDDGDHPRTRGVYRPHGFPWGRPGGSSPHTRGLHHLTNLVKASNGIIPAHAGFTVRFLTAFALAWDHPRTRGVYYHIGGLPPAVQGSSPHTRGLQLLVLR